MIPSTLILSGQMTIQDDDGYYIGRKVGLRVPFESLTVTGLKKEMELVAKYRSDQNARVTEVEITKVVVDPTLSHGPGVR